MSGLNRNNRSAGAKLKKFKKCILHIGTEKTGTKAIQYYLDRDRNSLQREGILYPKAAETGHASQWEFVAAVDESSWDQDIGRSFGFTRPEDQQRFSERLVDLLNEEFQRTASTHTLLLSSEHFQSRLNSKDKIRALRTFLATWVEGFEIIVYFRRQDQLALSFLSTRLKSSVDLKHTDLISAMKSTPRYYEYLKIYEDWAEVFGQAAIKVRTYQPNLWHGGTIVDDFCFMLNLPTPTQAVPVLNTSLNRKGFQFLQQLNARFPITPGDTNDLVRLELVQFISDNFCGKFYPISKDEARAFYEPYKASNQILNELAFPNNPAPLFDEDFSEYPEVPENAEPSYVDALEISMALWKHRSSEAITRRSLKDRIRARLKRTIGRA